MRRVVKILRPYLGRDALSPAHQRRREVELICVVARFQNFESIAARLSLRDLGDQMSRFYDAVADSIMNADGDLNRFCGAAVVGHFNVLHKVEEARILDSAIDAFQHAHNAFDAALDAKIGVGVCRSMAIAGAFGSTHRVAHTAFGPSEICAHHLAKKNDSISVCERFAEHLSRAQIPEQPSVFIAPCWKIEA